MNATIDKDKLLAVAQSLRVLDVPKMDTEGGQDIVIDLLPSLTRLAEWLEHRANAL